MHKLQGFRGTKLKDVYKRFFLLTDVSRWISILLVSGRIIDFCMNKMKLSVWGCFWCLLCLQWNAFAQNKVVLSGKVEDAKGKPVYMATVVADHTPWGTYTGEDGKYTLEIVPGEYDIVVSFVGYKTIRKKIDLRQNMSGCHFVLEENDEMLEEVGVVGKSKSLQVKESAYSVNVLDVKAHYNTLSRLSSLVNRTTGVRIREEGGVGSDFSLSINGLSGNSIRYFVNGVPLASLGRGVNLGNLPVNSVERIEVYKGVVPAYLGSDALGGAINIITNEKQKDYLDVSYGFGSFHTHKADLNARHVNPENGFTVSAGLGLNYSKNNYLMKGVEVWDAEQQIFTEKNLRRFHDDYFSVLGRLELGVTRKRWADLFLIAATATHENKDIQTGAVQKVVYGKAARQQHAFSASAQYRKRNFLTDRLNVDLFLSYTADHYQVVDTAYRVYWWDGTFSSAHASEMAGRGKSIRNYKRPLTVLRSGLDYFMNENHAFQLNYLLEHLNNKRTDDVDESFVGTDDALAKHILGLSYNQYFGAGRWNNTFFVKNYINRMRVEQEDLYWITGADDMGGKAVKDYWGGGAGSRYTFSDGLSLKASFEHSIRLPLATEFLGNGTTVYPNFNLKPENSDNFNIGAFGFFAGPVHRLDYETNFFYRKVKDYIYCVLSESEGLSQYENVTNVSVSGAEAELRYGFTDRFQALVNCSYQHAVNKTKYNRMGGVEITYKNKMPNQPWFFGNAELRYTKPDLFFKEARFSVEYDFQYVHWFYLTWEGYGVLKSKSTIPDQYVHHVVVSYSLQQEKYNISLECNNILDRKTFDNYMLQKPGRSFFCKFRFFINKQK